MFNAAENPLIPMGAVTGRPGREKIHAFLRTFREAGFTQFMIYPRSGCELEYMSAEWFDTCSIILDECREQGFSSVWLYDEFNWPSGQCGGRLMLENPEYSLKYLRVSEKDGHYSFDIFSNPKAPDVLNPEAMRKFIACTHEKYAEKTSAPSSKDFSPTSLLSHISAESPPTARGRTSHIIRDWKKITKK